MKRALLMVGGAAILARSREELLAQERAGHELIVETSPASVLRSGPIRGFPHDEKLRAEPFWPCPPEAGYVGSRLRREWLGFAGPQGDLRRQFMLLAVLASAAVVATGCTGRSASSVAGGVVERATGRGGKSCWLPARGLGNARSKPLTPPVGSTEQRCDQEPAWSPDGSKVAFVRNRAE